MKKPFSYSSEQEKIISLFLSIFHDPDGIARCNDMLGVPARVCYPFFSDEYVFVLNIYASYYAHSCFSGIVCVYSRRNIYCCEHSYIYRFWVDNNMNKLSPSSKPGIICYSFVGHYHDHEEYIRKIEEFKQAKNKKQP